MTDTIAKSETAISSNGWAEFGPTYLRFQENTPYEAWALILSGLQSAEKSIHWWIGDGIRFGERKYGETYTQALEESSYKYQTLNNDVWVADSVQISRRRENLSWSHHAEVAALEADEQDRWLDFAQEKQLSRNELRAAIKEEAGYVHFSSDTPEWYTPEHIIEGVIQVMGNIDLDPCADSTKGVPALNHFLREDDGLALVWAGRVYMNPPYGTEIVKWVKKLVLEHNQGDVNEAIALVPARTDTQWFSLMRAYPRCFIRGRLKFSGHENSAPFPSAVFYLGANRPRFVEIFSELGDVFERVGP